MPVTRVAMHKIKEVLRLKYAAALTHRQIAGALNLSVGVVNKYLAAAERAALTYPLPADCDDAQLAQLLFGSAHQPASLRRQTLDFALVHQELKRKGVTRQLLWEEYRASQPAGYGYTQFCVLYGEWRKSQKLSMRFVHRAGEKLFVDYCGQTVSIIDAVTGAVREAQVFVAVLGASNYTFAASHLDTKLARLDWLACPRLRVLRRSAATGCSRQLEERCRARLPLRTAT